MTRILHTEIKSGERLVATDITDLTFFPKGTILTFSSEAYSATSTGFKAIWKICDGQNGTPNLVNRFLRGSSSSGATGGTDSQNITLNTNNLPSHSHTMQSAGKHSHTYYIATLLGNAGGVGWSDDDNPFTTPKTTSTDGEHTHTIGNTGNGQPFTVNTLPAYYAVIYVIKTA
jgi:microcystin-dependent protein